MTFRKERDRLKEIDTELSRIKKDLLLIDKSLKSLNKVQSPVPEAPKAEKKPPAPKKSSEAPKTPKSSKAPKPKNRAAKRPAGKKKR